MADDPEFSTKNIEIGGKLGSIKLTGGSAMAALGLIVLFGADWLMGLAGGGPAHPALRYGVGGVLLVAGIIWFFTRKDAPPPQKKD